ncbi:MAG: LacI family DNA-binding transcriptional regulator [Pseudomonadota bacterium]
MTLKKVAELAGVSHTTVSLVINNAEGSRVSQKTRERVLKTIRKLDYNPNLTAKRLASGKTDSIGLFIPFEMPIFRNYAIIEMIAGIQDVLNEMGLDLVLFSGGRKLYRDRPIRQIVSQNTMDGLIIINTRYTSQHYISNYIKNLIKLKFNFVILNYYWGKAKVNYVGLDYENDAYKAVMHLMSLGHKHVALLAGPSKATVTSKVIKGYQRALRDYKANIENDIILYTNYDYQMAYEKTRMIINNNPAVTSFFLGDFEMAPACLKAVKDSGLNVPEDISIMCYIDNEIIPLLDPPITAVMWPYYDMGKKAAEMLLGNDGEKRRVIFETELVVRGSTSTIR